MPALLYESRMRSRLPTCWATAWVFSSCECPEVIANSPSRATTFGDGPAPMKSQKAALPAAVAMPMPDGPPLTSLVRSVVSECPASERMPRSPAWAKSGSPSTPASASSVASAPAPRRKPRQSMDSIATAGSTRKRSSPVAAWRRAMASPMMIHRA